MRKPAHFRFARTRRSRRVGRGVYLLETMVAITVGGIITFALLQMLTGSLRSMNTSASESVASEILNSLCEFTISSGYSGLQAHPGSFTLLLNRTQEGTSGPEIYKRPVFLDFVRKQWQAKSLSRAFNGAVTYTVSPGAPIEGLNALTVTVDVTWADSGTQGQRHLQRVLTVFQ